LRAAAEATEAVEAILQPYKAAMGSIVDKCAAELDTLARIDAALQASGTRVDAIPSVSSGAKK
jgi:hypothetical protein